MQARLILASASARRKKILGSLGVEFTAVTPTIREVLHISNARRTALENSAAKMAWCRVTYPDCHCLAADTIIDFEGRCVAKACTPEEACDFLRMFAGKTHKVYTAVSMLRPHTQPEQVLVESSVLFRPLKEKDIRAYVERVKPMDRAGAYDIDQQGDDLIESYEGSFTNIMGLPVEAICGWLKQEKFL